MVRVAGVAGVVGVVVVAGVAFYGVAKKNGRGGKICDRGGKICDRGGQQGWPRPPLPATPATPRGRYSEVGPNLLMRERGVRGSIRGGCTVAL